MRPLMDVLFYMFRSPPSAGQVLVYLCTLFNYKQCINIDHIAFYKMIKNTQGPGVTSKTIGASEICYFFLSPSLFTPPLLFQVFLCHVKKFPARACRYIIIQC